MDKQLLRIGRISSYNFPDGTARVTYDDKDGSTTPEIPFLAWEHWRPKIGDQVLVGHLSNGTSRAIILGPFWYEGHRPHGGREGLYRQEYTSTLGGDAAEYPDHSGRRLHHHPGRRKGHRRRPVRRGGDHHRHRSNRGDRRSHQAHAAHPHRRPRRNL